MKNGFEKILKIAALTGGMLAPHQTSDTQSLAKDKNPTTITNSAPEKESTNSENMTHSIDDAGMHWIPKEHVLKSELVHDILNSDTNNFPITLDGKSLEGTLFEIDFYGKKIKVIAFNDSLNHAGAQGDPSSNSILINKESLKKGYALTKEFLIACSLENEVVPIEDMCEAVLMQEIWHLLNSSTEQKKQEYFSEYPSLDSKAGHFYITAKFLENNDALFSKEIDENYSIVRESYKKTFETDTPTMDQHQLALKFKELVVKYGFDGLAQRYKDFR